MPLILIVEDEENIVELLSFNLQKEGYRVIAALDGNTALKITREEMPDLIILDIMLPGIDGLEICKVLKSEPETAEIPIIILSAKGEVLDKVLGLELGADDYMAKPFSPREVVARVKAHLRKKVQAADKAVAVKDKGEIRVNQLVIRPEKYEVVLDGEKLDLTPKEFEILHFLAKNPGRVLTRDMLLERIWGYEYMRETRTVDVHIRYLRRKIEKDPNRPKFIETVRGVGYRFKERNHG
ncbi:MAG: DNA-binding response regulator [Peptococcaceae bacterium]|nr:MAG: DNA-binding response regulator [Peptococcaceae bacterium]